MRTCKNCKQKFEPQYNSVQMVCSPKCAVDYSYKVSKEKRQKDWNKRKTKMKDSIKTYSDYLKELQEVFNRYIRLRDAHLPCISCGRHHEGQYHAGHYRSVGSSPEHRFNPKNVHKQCAPCNTHLHGNIVEYRKRLIKKIGVDEVELLENEHIPMKYSIPELIELKVIYKDKIKQLNK